MSSFQRQLPREPLTIAQLEALWPEAYAAALDVTMEVVNLISHQDLKLVQEATKKQTIRAGFVPFVTFHGTLQCFVQALDMSGPLRVRRLYQWYDDSRWMPVPDEPTQLVDIAGQDP